MSTKTNILITGATGYIGGSVVSRFLQRPDLASFKLTALVRSPEKAAKLKALGVNTVVGSHSDTPLMESLAADSDVVFSMADSDNLEAALATLKGLKKRHDATGKTPSLIHTSGTGVLTDNADGEYLSDVIYDDANPDQIETLPDTALHRNVDLAIVAADREGYLKSYIILPSAIYGIAKNTLVEKGISNPYGVQIPVLIAASLDRGRAGRVGAGKNVWPNVHIDDLGELYHVLFDAIRKEPTTGHGRAGYYFGENGEHNLGEVSSAIGEVMVALGQSESPEPTAFNKEEMDKYVGNTNFLGTNSRARANHSRAIGWKPVYTTADLFASIKTDVEVLVAKTFKA
ncbi:hypothetical protein BJ912DRAFT_1057475 [Pholiota molesta]|nr:hypothetical protein BJ912DRAFT_1057475 [Pholiota molesta]